MKDTSKGSNSPGRKPRKKRYEGDGKPKDRGDRSAYRYGIRLTKMPTDLQHIEVRIYQFRAHLEDAVLELRGTITRSEAMAIATACRWEMHGMSAGNWLRREHGKLTTRMRLELSEAVARAATERDKAVARLALDHRVDPLDEYYNTPDER